MKNFLKLIDGVFIVPNARFKWDGFPFQFAIVATQRLHVFVIPSRSAHMLYGLIVSNFNYK
jgi:hypothetical protein